MSGLTESERAEMAALSAKVSAIDPATGRHPHWTQAERDRVRALSRKESPSIRFAMSTEEIGRLFGHRSQREAS